LKDKNQLIKFNVQCLTATENIFYIVINARIIFPKNKNKLFFVNII